MPSSAPEVAKEVAVGERLRTIRIVRRRTLREVAERAGISESFLSQVERGRSSASTRTTSAARKVLMLLGDPRAGQRKPTIRPSASTSMRSAAGCAGRPGIVCMSPHSARIQPAPV